MLSIAYGLNAYSKGVKNNILDGLGVSSIRIYELIKSQFNVHPFVFDDVDKLPNVENFTAVGSFKSATLRSVFFKNYKPISDIGNIDIIHCPDHYIVKCRHIPTVATIHDVIPFTNPEYLSPRFRYIYRHIFKESIRNLDRYITVSEYSKSQIVEVLNISDEKIDVVYNPIPDLRLLSQSDEIFDVPHHKYFICIGTIQPRKNVDFLIQAYQRLNKQLKEEYKLIIVGRYGWGCESFFKYYGDHKEHDGITWYSGCSDYILHQLLKHAECLVIPSLAEGFCIPIIEAFNLGTPVLATSNSAIAEIGGDAVMYFSPTDIESLIYCIETFVSDKSIGVNMVQRGNIRKLRFSNDAVLSSLVNSYAKLV